MSVTLAVGLLGAGQVTQAIHLPTLATLADRLRVTHVMDVDASVAASVAARAGARWSTDADSVLADPDVDIVAVCSPHEFHAAQAEAACRVGKRAVFCEKPLAESVEQAQAVANASAETGVPVIVGTMHIYDPAVAAAWAEWGTLPHDTIHARSVILLPSNDDMVNLSTDQAFPAAAVPVSGNPPTPEGRAALIRGALLGLAIHNTPLLRPVFPAGAAVTEARVIPPAGYSITLSDGSKTAHLAALTRGTWDPKWIFEVWSQERALQLDFPPPYVLSGSAVATLTSPRGARSWHFPDNGYQAEWRHVAEVAEGVAQVSIPMESAIADIGFTINIADRAARLILAG